MKLIQTKDYLLLIDEEVKRKVNAYYVGEGFSGKNLFRWTESQEKKYPNQKQIAVGYYPLTKESKKLYLPLLPNPFEAVDIEKLANTHAFNSYEKEDREVAKNSFIAGYKAAQVKQFSLDDIKKALEHGWYKGKEHGIIYRTVHEGQDRREDIKTYIQSLSTQQLPKEFIPEYEKEHDDTVPFPKLRDSRIIKTTTNSEGKQELVGVYIY